MSGLKHYVLKNRSGWQSEENDGMALKNKTIRINKNVELKGGGEGDIRAGIEGWGGEKNEGMKIEKKKM